MPEEFVKVSFSTAQSCPFHCDHRESLGLESVLYATWHKMQRYKLPNVGHTYLADM